MSIFIVPTTMHLLGCTDMLQETLSEIPYVDNPEIRINEHESIEMPFRYMTDLNGLPIMPKVSYVKQSLNSSAYFRFFSKIWQGMIDLIKNDSEKGFGDVL